MFEPWRPSVSPAEPVDDGATDPAWESLPDIWAVDSALDSLSRRSGDEQQAATARTDAALVLLRGWVRDIDGVVEVGVRGRHPARRRVAWLTAIGGVAAAALLAPLLVVAGMSGEPRSGVGAGVAGVKVVVDNARRLADGHPFYSTDDSLAALLGPELASLAARGDSGALDTVSAASSAVDVDGTSSERRATASAGRGGAAANACSSGRAPVAVGSAKGHVPGSRHGWSAASCAGHRAGGSPAERSRAERRRADGRSHAVGERRGKAPIKASRPMAKGSPTTGAGSGRSAQVRGVRHGGCGQIAVRATGSGGSGAPGPSSR